MTQLLWPWTGLSCIYVQWLDDICGQKGLFEATFQIYNRWDTFPNEMDLAITFCTNDSCDNSTWALSSLGGVLCLKPHVMTHYTSVQMRNGGGWMWGLGPKLKGVLVYNLLLIEAIFGL